MGQHIRIASFRREDQAPVRDLILAGLAERWGDDADPTLNPDLDDIARSYAGGTTLVAWLDGVPVGTGTVVPRQARVEEVVRMSVTSAARGRGVARRLLGELVDAAAARGARRVVCETCSHWESAVRLYLAFGFTVTHYRHSGHCLDAHFALDLPRVAGPGRTRGESRSALIHSRPARRAGVRAAASATERPAGRPWTG